MKLNAISAIRLANGTNSSIPTKQQEKHNNNKESNVKKRLIIMATGMAIGTAGAAVYYINKKLPSKKLWLKSLEIGAIVGLLADITDMVLEIPKNIK